MEAFKRRPVSGLTPSNWANPITGESDDDLERLLATEAKRISQYLGFACPDIYHDHEKTVYIFGTKTVLLNRSWKKNCEWQLEISEPTQNDIEHFACFSLAHELAHRFQNEFLTFEDFDRAPELFEGHADLVAAHLYRDNFSMSSESTRFLVPAASSLQSEIGGGDREYPPGCIRSSLVAAGMASLAFPSTMGALVHPDKFFVSSLIRAFELVVYHTRICQLWDKKCLGCRGPEGFRFDHRFDLPSFEGESLAIGVRTLISYYEKVFKP